MLCFTSKHPRVVCGRDSLLKTFLSKPLKLLGPVEEYTVCWTKITLFSPERNVSNGETGLWLITIPYAVAGTDTQTERHSRLTNDLTSVSLQKAKVTRIKIRLESQQQLRFTVHLQAVNLKRCSDVWWNAMTGGGPQEWSGFLSEEMPVSVPEFQNTFE